LTSSGASSWMRNRFSASASSAISLSLSSGMTSPCA
jgi:hypothetical protein